MAKRVDPKLVDGQWWIDGPEGRAVWDEAADEWRYAPRPPGHQRRASFARRLAPYVAASAITIGMVAGFLWADKTTLHWVTGSSAVQKVQAALPARVSTPLGDHVVGVLRECVARVADIRYPPPVVHDGHLVFSPFADPTVTYRSVAETGDQCKTGMAADHLHLTIRRDDGAIYAADVPYDPTIAVGDTWPR